MLKSIDFWPLVPKKLSVESSINDDVHQKSMFNVGTIAHFYDVITHSSALSRENISSCLDLWDRK